MWWPSLCSCSPCLHSSCQLGVVSGSFPRVFQVELEARHSGAQSQLGSSIEIVSKGKGGVEQRTVEFCPFTHFFPFSSASCFLPLVQLPPKIKELPCLSLGAREGGTDPVPKWFSPWVCLGCADLVWFLPSSPKCLCTLRIRMWLRCLVGRGLCRVAEGVTDCPWGGSLSPVGLWPLPLCVMSLTRMFRGSLNPGSQALVILPLVF